MSCSDRDPVPPHFRGYPQFPLSLPSYLGPRVHATFPCCLCIRFFGPDCHRFRQWEHTPDKHHLMLKPAVQDTSVPVPWHSPILFFSQPHVSLSSQARYLPCPPQVQVCATHPPPGPPLPSPGCLLCVKQLPTHLALSCHSHSSSQQAVSTPSLRQSLIPYALSGHRLVNSSYMMMLLSHICSVLDVIAL